MIKFLSILLLSITVVHCLPSFLREFSLPKVPANAEISPAVEYRSITQRVNHFNPQDLRTFTNFYSVNEDLFQPGGPIIIFLYTPITDAIARIYLSMGPVFDLATKLNGTLMTPQIRYFDSSNVTEDLRMENLQYLSISQILEDIAHIIYDMKSSPRYTNSGVIFVGWDFGGSIATWFAQKYPHLVTGIWASGALTKVSIDNQSPITYVESAFQQFGGDNCTRRIENGFKELEELLATGQVSVIRRTFSLCFPLPYISGDQDIRLFFSTLISYFFVYTSLLDSDNLRDSACGSLLSAPVSRDYEALAFVMGFYNLNWPVCYAINYDEEINFLKDTSLGEFAPGRALTYLQCMEYGVFFSSGDGSSIFGGYYPIEFYVELCSDVFGTTREEMLNNYSRFNTLYGGVSPGTRNGFFTKGEFNPYTEQGVNSGSLHSTSTLEIVPNRGIHTELSIFIPEDPSYNQIRERAYEAIKGWLADN